MRLTDDGLELVVLLIIIGVLTALGVTVFSQYLDKARLTLSVAAMQQAQNSLRDYRAKSHAYPESLDFNECTDQNHLLVLRCDAIMADIETFESYVRDGETFVLKARAKDSGHTLITVTESAISF